MNSSERKDNLHRPEMPRYYLSVFIASFFLAIFLILLIQQMYLVVTDSELSRAWLVWNVLLLSAVVLVVLLMMYFVVKKLVTRQVSLEAKFRELAEQLPDPIFETDVDGTITFANRAATSTFGYSREELGNMSVLELVADFERTTGFDASLGSLEKEFLGLREYTARRRDGTEFPILVNSSLIIEEDEPRGLRGVVVEITELKRMERELKRANAELKAYAHMVSHDLKNPLASIRATSELLEETLRDTDKWQDGDVREAQDIQFKNIERATRIINDMLTLAEMGRPEEIVRVDVGQTVEEILDNRQAELEARGIEVEKDDELGTVVSGPTHIYQLFSNLIDNALAHGNCEAPVVRMEYQDRDGLHRYVVRDNGGGVPEEILADLFLPFVKGRATGDTGIGLSIVEKIVKIHGGTLKAYNDGGACFEFTLRDLADTAASESGRPSAD